MKHQKALTSTRATFKNFRRLWDLTARAAFAACLVVGWNEAVAATNVWVHTGVDTSWFTPANWSPAVPTAADEAYIGNGTTAFVSGTNAATAGSLIIDSGGVTIGNVASGTLDVTGQVNVGTAGSTGTLILNSGALSLSGLTLGVLGSYTDTTLGTLTLTGSAPGITNAVDIVVNSVIQGTNGLTKSGSSTLTLANDNSYTGGTTIAEGTLQVGTGGTTGSLGGGDVTNNGVLIFDRSNGYQVTNGISGSGSVVKAGGGAATFTGDNTYSGGTTLSNGTLQVGDGGTTGSLGSGNITNNASLAFNRSDDFIVANAISGSGSLTQMGSNTLTFTADNTYAGTTTISSNGTVQVGDGGTAGSVGAGAVVNNGTLAFDRSDDVVVSNLISGTGGLVQGGGGTLTLAANNTYTGSTTITNGTLQVGAGGTTGSLGTNAVYNDGALVFNRSNSLEVLNVISGTGSVNHAGTGFLGLSASNSYSGGTFVSNGGTLVVLTNTALGSGDLNVLDGTFEAYSTGPTNLIIPVGGNYVQGTNGTLRMTIGGTVSDSDTNQYDQLHAAGTANLAGTLDVVGGSGYQPQHNDQQVLLTAAGGVTGTIATFTNEISHSPLVEPQLVYNPNDLTLKWQQLSFMDYLVATNGVKLTHNQRAVGRGLDSILSSTATNDVALINHLDYLTDLTNGLPAAFDQIAPEELSSMLVASFANMDAQGNGFLKRAAELRTDYRRLYRREFTGRTPPEMQLRPDFDRLVENPWNFYFGLPFNFVNVKGDANASGFDISGFGVNLGADRRLNDRLIAGGGIGYGNEGANLAQGGRLNLDTFNGEIYAVWLRGGLHFEGMLGANFGSYTTDRAAVGGTAHGSASGFGWTGLLGGGYDWTHGPWEVGPDLSLQYMSANIDSFTENGSLSPLRIYSQNQDAAHTQLGVNLRYHYFVRDSWTILTPAVYFGWRHDLTGNSFSIQSRFASGAGNSFTVQGPNLGSDSILLSLGVNVQWKPAWSSYLGFTAQMGRSGYSSQNLNLGVRYSF